MCWVCNHVKILNCRVHVWILAGGVENSFRKVKSFHLFDKKHTNLSQFFWLDDFVVLGWLAWGVAVRDMLSLFCGEIVLPEIFSNVFIAKSKNEFPDMWSSTIFGGEKLYSPKLSPIAPGCTSEVLTYLLCVVRGTLEFWEFISAVLLARLQMLYLVSFYISFHA